MPLPSRGLEERDENPIKGFGFYARTFVLHFDLHPPEVQAALRYESHSPAGPGSQSSRGVR